MVRQPVNAIEHPDGFDYIDQADETGMFFCQRTLDYLRCLPRLDSGILCEIAHEDISIQTDHRRLVRCVPVIALSPMRVSI